MIDRLFWADQYDAFRCLGVWALVVAAAIYFGHALLVASVR